MATRMQQPAAQQPAVAGVTRVIATPATRVKQFPWLKGGKSFTTIASRGKSWLR